MFPIDTWSLSLLAFIGFALFASLSFLFALHSRGRKWLSALPVISALAVVGYLSWITEWEKEYAGLLPIFVGLYLAATLAAALIWVSFAHLVFGRLASDGSTKVLIVAALPSLIAAVYVVWDQTLPRNDCAISHLDVSVAGGGQYRVYPEFSVRFDNTTEGGTGQEFQARYSSLSKDKLDLARLCRQVDRLDTAQIWITPTARADAVASACETSERPYCSNLDTDFMRQLHTVKISHYDRSKIDNHLGWFSRTGDSEVFAMGDAQEGAVCTSVGSRSQNCTVWRRFGDNQLGVAKTIQGTNGLSPEEMIAVANKGLDQLLHAFSPPKR